MELHLLFYISKVTSKAVLLATVMENAWKLVLQLHVYKANIKLP